MQLDGFQEVSQVLRAGVYALCHRGQVVYVGKAKTLLSRVAAHRSMWGKARRGQAIPDWIPIKGILFDECFIRTCRTDQLDALEREMINKYKPKFNILLKTGEKITAPIALTVNGISIDLNQPATGGLERRV